MKAETAIYTAFEDYTHRDTAEPEKNLMRAIMRTVMEDLKKRGDVYQDARSYVLSDDTIYLYSFENVCNHLNLCPRTIRTILGIDGLTQIEESEQSSSEIRSN